jgi:hypothetical protein
MSSRRKPARFNDREMFTLTEVLLASPVGPMPAADARQRYASTLVHLERLATAPDPSALDWRTVAMAGNVIEVLLGQGVVQDPDGLLYQAFEAMRAAARRHAAGGAIRFTGPELVAVRAMVRDWGEILEQCPHRTLLQAFRRVYSDIQKSDASALQTGHLAAQLDHWRAPAAT